MNRSPGCFRSFPASAFLTLAAALFLAVSCTPPQDSGPEPRDTIRDYSYGTDGLQTMDIWFPLEGNASRGAVVIVHGGSWIAGDKTDLDDFIMRRIANLGYVTVTMNYRLADPEPEGAQPVGFSAMLEDIESVLDTLDANSADWGCDPDRIALVGLSAGGHLALMKTLTENADMRIKACASLSGPVDLTDSEFRAYQYSYGEPATQTSVGEGIAAILGVPYDQAEDAQNEEWNRWSPLSVVAGLSGEAAALTVPEWYLAWGTADDFVPYATQGVKLELALTAKGAEVASRACVDDGHDLESSALTIIDTDLSGLLRRTIR